jgi:hypothetical protein
VLFVLNRNGRTVSDEFAGNRIVSPGRVRLLKVQTPSAGREFDMAMLEAGSDVPLAAEGNRAVDASGFVVAAGKQTRSAPCPLPSAARCARVADETGKRVSWPVTIEAMKSRWFSIEPAP